MNNHHRLAARGRNSHAGKPGTGSEIPKESPYPIGSTGQ